MAHADCVAAASQSETVPPSAPTAEYIAARLFE
jgi:hypothetical protein